MCSLYRAIPEDSCSLVMRKVLHQSEHNLPTWKRKSVATSGFTLGLRKGDVKGDVNPKPETSVI